MFTLSRIAVKNFMSITEQEIEFNEGILGITGENGSGKSSLLNAIGLCLTEYRAGDSLRDYVKAGELEARVDLEGFYKGYPISYEVIINNRPYGNPLKRKVSYRGRVYENSDYSKFIKHENLENLEKVMFLFQGDTSLTSIKPSERAAILKQLFNFNFEDQVGSLSDSIFSAQEDKTRMQGSLDAYRSRTFEKQNLEREIRGQVISSWEEEYLSLNHQLASLENIDVTQVRSLEEKIKFMKEERTKTVESISLLEKSINRHRNEINDLEVLIARSKEETIPPELTQDIEDQKRILKELEAELREINEKKSLCSYRVEELKNQAEIGKKGYCHSCGQKIEDSYVEGILSQLAENKIKLEELQENCRGIQERIREVELLKASKENLLKHFREVVEEAEASRKGLEEKRSSLEVLENSLKEKKSSAELLNSQISYLEGTLKEKGDLLEKLEEKESLLKKSADLESKINEAKAIKAGNEVKRAQNEKIEREKKECDDQILKLSAEINEKDVKIKNLKGCLDVFQRDFPNFIILRACSQLEGYVNEFVHRVFPYMNISLKQDRQGVQFYYKIKGQDRDLSIKMASGAQKSVLTLAYKIAEAKLYGLDCIILDECDASLNDENSSILYKFIAEINSFKQLIFVSHRKKAIKEVYESFKGNMRCYQVDSGVYNEVDPDCL